MGRRRRHAVRIALAGVLLTLYAGSAYASHWATNGWYDRHYNYPPVPNGYTAIVNVFGRPCNSNAYYNSFY